VQPALHQQRIQAYGAIMVEQAERASERWERLDGMAGGRARRGAPEPGGAVPAPALVDVHGEMMRLALAVVGRALVGAEVEDEAEELGEAIASSLELFRSYTTLPFAGLVQRLPLPSTRRFARARRRLDATIHRLVAARRSRPADRGDLLSMLLDARDDETGGHMSDGQLRDELMTLFLAGHETTANALTWTWYLLSRHPDAEARLHAELLEVLGDRRAEAGDLARLRYAWRVVAESMRLYPPAWVIGRRAVADYEAGGHRFPRGSILLLSQWVLHRDPRFYPDPERFDPERWTDAGRAARPRLAYFPFGAGPRSCIGEQFAWTEAVLVLATLARRWRLRLAPEHRVALQPSITLRPRGGMPMALERRGQGARVS
jgi:cytochrome P450